MKGQYMAIEAVLSLGLSLIVAVAALTAFGGFRDSMIQNIEERNLEIASSEVISTIYNLRFMGEGSKVTVKLPENGDVSYEIAFGQDSAEIAAGDEETTFSLEKFDWVSEFRGSAKGNTFEIVKLDESVQVKSK